MSKLDDLYDDFNVLSRDLSQGRADIFRSMSDLDLVGMSKSRSNSPLQMTPLLGNIELSPNSSRRNDLPDSPFYDLQEQFEDYIDHSLSNSPTMPRLTR